MDLDPHWFWSAGSGSGKAKMTHKIAKKWRNFKCWIFSFEGWRLLLSLDVLFGDLGTIFVAIFEKKISTCKILQVLVIKPLDPHWPKMLGQDPYWNQCGSTTLDLAEGLITSLLSTSLLSLASTLVKSGCQCCGTATIIYGSGSDFWKVMVPVPQHCWLRVFLRGKSNNNGL